MTGLFAGRYAIERLIGEGATAKVYLARDTQGGRAVALKMLRPELAQSTASERFGKEIRRMNALNHPRILPVLDSGEFEGQMYIALPYMEGGSLRDRLQREKQLPIDESLAVVRTIAEALDYAHKQGLIHRDVKPENILFTGGEPVLADFGVARALEKILEETSTSTGIVRGTPAYMSPEQASGSSDYDGRSDIYALGCVLYEMLAGLPAFIGPTPESVIAQRFAFPPRQLRAYRPSVPPALELAIAKALEILPADRYRTASDFAEALNVAMTTGSLPVQTLPGRSSSRRRALLVGAAITGVAIIGAVAIKQSWDGRTPRIVADTTRLLVFPLEIDSATSRPWRDDDLLHEAFARWRGVSLVDQFQISDALKRAGSVADSKQASLIASSLGAGRYIRGRAGVVGRQLRVSLSIYDASQANPLYQASELVSTDLAHAVVSYSKLADALLLRGSAPDSSLSKAAPQPNLPAVQAFGRGQRALDDWDLRSADSAFQAAVTFDPNFARAGLWLAQIRAWNGQPRNAWGTIAERAAGNSEQLTTREMKLARGLVFLSRQQFDNACAIYDGMVAMNARDFAAWYGAGQCRMLNKLVIRDSLGPSGWRFVASARRGVDAYFRAFELLPSVHRGYERGAFEQLARTLLLVPNFLIRGESRDGQIFVGRPGLVADTLTLVAYPLVIVNQGRSNSIPPGFRIAIERQRRQFRRLALGWSAAFPRSPAAKYAVARSMEFLGDPSAIDTLRLARRLSTDPYARLGLGAEEVMAMIKFGASDPVRLGSARRLADSLFAAASSFGSTASLDTLAPVAVILGRCTLAERFIRSTHNDNDRVPARLLIEGEVRLVRTVIRCPPDVSGWTTETLIRNIDAEHSKNTQASLPLMENTLLYRESMLADTLRPALIKRLAVSMRTPLLLAATHLLDGDRSQARDVLDSSDANTPTDVAVVVTDGALAKARMRLRLGDTTRALQVLDNTLADLPSAQPGMLNNVANAAALAAMMVLRADVGADVAARQKWARAITELWSEADAPLQPTVTRMRAIAARP